MQLFYDDEDNIDNQVFSKQANSKYQRVSTFPNARFLNPTNYFLTLNTDKLFHQSPKHPINHYTSLNTRSLASSSANSCFA
jgi:hypothetical protein